MTVLSWYRDLHYGSRSLLFQHICFNTEILPYWSPKQPFLNCCCSALVVYSDWTHSDIQAAHCCISWESIFGGNVLPCSHSSFSLFRSPLQPPNAEWRRSKRQLKNASGLFTSKDGAWVQRWCLEGAACERLVHTFSSLGVVLQSACQWCLWTPLLVL